MQILNQFACYYQILRYQSEFYTAFVFTYSMFVILLFYRRVVLMAWK